MLIKFLGLWWMYELIAFNIQLKEAEAVDWLCSLIILNSTTILNQHRIYSLPSYFGLGVVG